MAFAKSKAENFYKTFFKNGDKKRMHCIRFFVACFVFVTYTIIVFEKEIICL